MTYVDAIRLQIYEAFDNNDLTVAEKEILLESINDKLFPEYSDHELQLIHETTMKASMLDTKSKIVAQKGVIKSSDRNVKDTTLDAATNLSNKLHTNYQMGRKVHSDESMLQDSLQVQKSLVDDLATASKDGIKVGIAMSTAVAAVIAGIYAIGKKRSISIKNKRMVNNISSNKWDDIMAISKYLEEMQKEIVDIKKRLADYTTELNNKKSLANPITKRKEIKKIEQEIKRQNRRLKQILKELEKTKAKFCNMLSEKNGYQNADELKKNAMKLFNRLDEYATKLDDSYEKL